MLYVTFQNTVHTNMLQTQKRNIYIRGVGKGLGGYQHNFPPPPPPPTDTHTHTHTKFWVDIFPIKKLSKFSAVTNV